MTHFAAQIASAQRSIAAKGAPVTFVRGEGTYDRATDTFSTPPVTAASVAIRQEYGRASGTNKTKLAAGSEVVNSPISLLVAAAGLGAFAPAANDRMTFAGVTYTVADVDTLAPDGAAILYTVAGAL